jgi:hypothetical protein
MLVEGSISPDIDAKVQAALYDLLGARAIRNRGMKCRDLNRQGKR